MGSPAYARGRDERAERDERELVLRARSGDRAAFEDIVRRHQKRLYRIALRMTRRHDVADDVVQESFVRAYRSLGGFDAERPLGPWLARIATNLCLDHFGRAKARREVALDGAEGESGAGAVDPPAPDVPSSNPHRRLAARELAAALAAAVDELGPEQKAVFVLKVYEGLRYEEIARILDISVGTVMSRLSRARAKLRRRLEDHL